MTHQVYTIGYTGRKPADIEKVVKDLDAILLDIRFSPYSRVSHWMGYSLRAKFGDRYHHVKALGNANYKGGSVEIVDYAAGRDTIESLDKPVILMCACGDPATCHRTVVAEMLRADGFTVAEIDQSFTAPSKPAAQTWTQASLFQEGTA